MKPFKYEEADDRDFKAVKNQIGREPRGMLGVAKRCGHGYPMVVITDAIIDGEPFPTTFWLSCPALVKAVSALESEKAISDLEGWLAGNDEAAREMERAHHRAVGNRLKLLPPEELERLEREEPGKYEALAKKGIGGLTDPLKIKCLHLHVADQLAQGGNPVGRRVLEMLKERGIAIPCKWEGIDACDMRGICEGEDGPDA